MKIATMIAQILLGLMFFMSGLSGFLFHPPPPPGLAGEFFDAYSKSHWLLFVDAFQLLAGLLLLANRFVPLGLTILAAIIVNIVIMHLTMVPSGLPMAVVVVALWFFVARKHWSYFAPLFVAKAVASIGTAPAVR